LKFLIVEDETAVQFFIEKVISKVYPNAVILKCDNGLSAWDIINKEESELIIFSDIFMPGMNGLQLLKKIRSSDEYKEYYFIAGTASNDVELNLKILQQGANNFIQKPFQVDSLLSALKTAVSYYNNKIIANVSNEKIEALNNIINEERQTVYSLLKRFQEIKLRTAEINISNIIDPSKWIANQLCDTQSEINDIEKSSELAYIGKLYIPDAIFSKPVLLNGLISNTLMEEVPKFTQELSSYIKDNENISKILYHIWENYDGSGIPKKLKKWEIPLGSRILRVVIEYYEASRKSSSRGNKIVEQLLYDSRRLYDFKVVAYLDQYLAWRESQFAGARKPIETPVSVRDLVPGCIITRNILTNSGLFLMASHTQLTEDKIDKIKEIIANDPIIGKIYIRYQDFEKIN